MIEKNSVARTEYSKKYMLKLQGVGKHRSRALQKNGIFFLLFDEIPQSSSRPPQDIGMTNDVQGEGILGDFFYPRIQRN